MVRHPYRLTQRQMGSPPTVSTSTDSLNRPEMVSRAFDPSTVTCTIQTPLCMSYGVYCMMTMYYCAQGSQ